ncbi:MAG TPA: UdgX family uracil-DNA binding protein [Methylibium sp.]|uniref:UdgX family uracil-DNA binding protein n=1 Tax=Methylibium sp. TaxID=2067992 RepID=UPI002DBEB78E|nr:UdgX family uracil-DNA binding protein [Methylibium sp.]HEU4458487.1 UdgX family uracil-DNA binding protein [Methylibium sp.]
MPARPAPADAPLTITLAGETDFEGFRGAARRLIARGVAPDAVAWAVAERDEPGLFGAEAGANEAASNDETPVPSALRVSPAFVALCREVALHRDPARFALMYRLLWRWQREPGLRDDPLDADMARANAMAQVVRRDLHKMKAFVRFREVQQEGGETLHVAWFEPEHHIVEAVAGFFMRRFTGMRWAILTPERCVRWNGEALEFTPGAKKEDAPAADAGEALWLTYYRAIFNPARLKLRAMEKEMPRRYWPNLPEAELIGGLAAHAYERSAGMVEQPPTTPKRRLPDASPRRRIPIAAPFAASTLDPDDADGALEAQRDAAAGCRECPLGALATQTVWGEGPAGSRLMLVGEQPGDQEDLQGRPFVGPAGQLLMRAMTELGWPRDAVYITNAVKHFKYEMRGRRRIHKTPAQKEADACLHWLESEIALVRPSAIVALGATAARQLMGRPVAVTRERGQWLVRGDGTKVLITLHPSALLRMEPDQKEAAYEAWLNDLRRAE